MMGGGEKKKKKKKKKIMYQYRRLTKYEDIINKEGSVLQLAILFYSSLFTLYSPSINNDDTRQQDTKRTTIKIQNCSSSK